MKIMLISIPSSKGILCPILGLGYIASLCERAGHNCKIIDSLALGFDLKDIEREISFFDPDVVGVSVTTQYVYDAFDVAKVVKNFNPNCLVVFGGPHPSVLAGEVLRDCSSVDVVVRGEGELTFNELVDVFERDGDFSKVLGISFRRDGRIFNNPDRPLIEDLDIKDLEERLDQTKNSTIVRVYNNLINGSENHLRAFTTQLKGRGESYQVEYISQERYDSILSGSNGRGMASQVNNQVTNQNQTDFRVREKLNLSNDDEVRFIDDKQLRVEVRKHVKVLGIFKIKVPIEVEFNRDGEIEKIEKPWWAFWVGL